MNCFCYPGARGRILQALGLPVHDLIPEFGFKAELPLNDGTSDGTEIDMRLGDLIFEAKLTEADSTTCPKIARRATGDFSMYSTRICCPQPRSSTTNTSLSGMFSRPNTMQLD